MLKDIDIDAVRLVLNDRADKIQRCVAKVSFFRAVLSVMFFSSCLVQALNRREESHHSLHASAYYRKCNEGLITIR